MKKLICLVALGVFCSSNAWAASLETCPSGGFGTSLRPFIAALDDGGAQVDVSAVFPTGIRIDGADYTNIWINNNGNITFAAQNSIYTPDAIPGLTFPAIAVWYGDTDLRSGQGDIYSCIDPANNRAIFTWHEVGYYSMKTDKLNSYQIILTNAASECAGIPTADIQFRYNRLEWTTGDLSGGTGGLGGTPATAGIDAGDTINAVALPGSGGATVLDLVNQTNANDLGVFKYRLANGTLPSCGNGTLEVCEDCDLGANNDNNGACTEICQNNVCGDGYAYFGVETCDTGEVSPGFDQCPPGYDGFPVCNNDPANTSGNGTCTLAAIPAGCSDIDECFENTDNCSANGSCSNTAGGFTCACNPGFSGDGVTCTDINECAVNNGGCDANAACANTFGGFTCTCDSGYTGNGFNCTDVDECLLNTDNCDVNAVCANTDGGFTCTCANGYAGDGVTCADIDECALNTDNCSTDAMCANVTGGFTCICNAGFSGDGVTCADIDECATNADNCDANATCANTTGAFTCTCDAGFSGDGVTCADIDECATNTDNCDANATCTNSPGTFACACNTGYAGDGLNCADINECALGMDNCDVNALCANTVGGFDCTCVLGYNGDGVTCLDDDECALGTDNCDDVVVCTNEPGSFSCGACPTGYVDTFGNGTSCADIDECALGLDNCSALVLCTNTLGSFTCPRDTSTLQAILCRHRRMRTRLGQLQRVVLCTHVGHFTCGACPVGLP
ncbi:MAG: EGF domain-containing protein [bacterium]